VRDLDGRTRKVERWGTSKSGAQRALQDELRTRHGQRVEVLRPHSRFRDAAEVWLQKIRERRADSTLDLYSHWLNKLVLPQLGELRLAECDVATIDAFFSRLERARVSVVQDDGTAIEKPQYAAASRRTVRSVVSGVLQQAVLHQAIPSNPVRNLERIESPRGHQKPPPRGLTPEERRRLFEYVDQDPVSVTADLPDLIRFAIGTGLRIGELCAVRWRDVNLEGIAVINENDMRLVPVVAVRQNERIPRQGQGPRRPWREDLDGPANRATPRVRVRPAAAAPARR
jgi:integrase